MTNRTNILPFYGVAGFGASPRRNVLFVSRWPYRKEAKLFLVARLVNGRAILYFKGGDVYGDSNGCDIDPGIYPRDQS